MFIIMVVVLGFAIIVMNVGTILEAIADFADRMKAGEPIVAGDGINLPPFLEDLTGGFIYGLEIKFTDFIVGLKTNLILGLHSLFKI